MVARIQKSGSAGGKQRPIKYEKQLEFLKPHLQHRSQKSNLDSSSEETQDSSDHSRPTIIESPPPLSQTSTTSQHKVSEILQRYLMSKETEHPVDSFFLTMAGTVKRLPDRVQAEIKRKIFLIVNDAEITHCDQSTPSPRHIPIESTLDAEDIEEYIPTRVNTCYANRATSTFTYTPSSSATASYNTSSKNIPTRTYTPTHQNYNYATTSNTYTPPTNESYNISSKNYTAATSTHTPTIQNYLTTFTTTDDQDTPDFNL